MDLSRNGFAPRARRPDAFYGWWMVGLCTIALGFTAPGQTIGVSAFTDDLVESLDISRSALSTAYLIGTLTGALALPFIGRWVDAAGVRRSMLVVGSLFAVAVAATGAVQNIVMLTLAFVGLRMFGQGSLHLIGLTGVVIWFERRRGFALALSGMGSLAILSAAPLIFGVVIDAVGWRTAWPVIGATVAVVVVPIAVFGVVDRPDDLGQIPDGRRDPDGDEAGAPTAASATVAEAIRTPAFWTLAGLSFLAGAIVTGLTLHNTDLLGEQGLSKAQASAIFLPQALGSMSSSVAIAWMTDRFPARPLMLFGGVALAAGTFMATIASPGIPALAYGLVTGIAGGSLSAASGALYPKWFGVAHIGSIRGLATSLNVGASALGPLVLSIGNDIADSYEPVVTGCAIACLAMAAISVVVPTPDRGGGGATGPTATA